MSALVFVHRLLTKLSDEHGVNARIVKESWWRMSATIGDLVLHANDTTLRVDHNGQSSVWISPTTKSKAAEDIITLILKTLQP
jgi:hypothetical protein